MIKDLITKNRSYRRFHQDAAVSIETLHEMVDCARLSPSARNFQPLRYILSVDAERNTTIFQYLSWAAYLTDWPGPSEGERPSAYIVFLGDREVSQSFAVDEGICVQSMLLYAAENGLGGCIIASINKDGLRTALGIPEKYDILMVLALGKPKEEVVIEAMPADGNYRYWRDEKNIHHVPKRSLDDLILG